MSIEKSTYQTAPVHEITSNFKVVRYLDIVKFISMLQKETIFFCRLDKLEDKFEGTSPKPDKKIQELFYRQIYEAGHFKSENIEESVKKDMRDRNDMEERFKKLCCISCWNKFDHESYAMWKIYSDMNKGIMITSSIDNLHRAFENTSEKVQLTEIKYIDPETDFTGDPGNLNSPVLYKHKAYSFEDEIRLIHQVNTEDKFDYDWDSEKNKSGKSLKINLDFLVDEVILSPFAQPWFFEMIKDLMDKYNLNKPLKYSILK
jgi:hypothetical protein